MSNRKFKFRLMVLSSLIFLSVSLLSSYLFLDINGFFSIISVCLFIVYGFYTYIELCDEEKNKEINNSPYFVSDEQKTDYYKALVQLDKEFKGIM